MTPVPQDEMVAVALARIEERIIAIQADFLQLRKDSVTSKEFEPVKKLAYGLTAAVIGVVVYTFKTLVTSGR